MVLREMQGKVGTTKAESGQLAVATGHVRHVGDGQRRYSDRVRQVPSVKDRWNQWARLEKAEEITWGRQFMLLSEQLLNSRDGWYYTPEDVP